MKAAARTLLVMAGGTGGHVMPALAVADWLRARGWRVVWLGSQAGMEADLVPARGYPIRFIRFAGLRGKGLLRALLLPFNLLVALLQCARVIRAERPDVVLGMGGYISFPGGLTAALAGLPLVLHEQNAIAGMANRVLARWARRNLSGFPGVLPGGQWTGNPVRESIAALPDPSLRYSAREGRLRLLVVGGSLGAQPLNEAVPAALALLPETLRPLTLHQSGTRHIEALRAAYAHAGVQGECVAFIEDMAAALTEADVVLCRAGALTVAEIAAAGVAAVLVPLPHAVDDHQSANARFLSDAGAAVLLPQPELTPQRLAQLLHGFTRAALDAMARKARALARPEATRLVAEQCVAVAGSRP
ncbi:MAG: undecaprenyldiphospho-muramoylpentapeptide beta-N-acetylglucosaminyltransferase [Betaproteobacteria bacterium]